MSDIRVKFAELPGGQQALVNDGARGKRTEIGPRGALGFDQFAEQKELVLKRFAGFAGAEKALVNRRECGRSGGAEDCAVHRNFAPTATLDVANAGKFLHSSPCFILLTG